MNLLAKLGLSATFFYFVTAPISPALAEPLAVIDLRCEFASDPLGVDVPNPRLGWKVRSSDREKRQTAWQLVVATDPQLLEPGKADLWDSRKRTGGETTHLPYEGRPLASSQKVYWKLRVWDERDEPSDWSHQAAWTMGLLEKDDWKAEWIVAPWQTESVLLRKEFEIREGLKRATAHISGLGHYEMFLNGTKAGKALLAPGWTKYNKTCLYETHDITPLLNRGDNAIGLVLGDGMYHTERRNRFSKFQGTFGPQRTIAQLELEYEDGSLERVITDESWRVSAGPVVYNDVYGGEDYDARRHQAGWDSPGFDDADWATAAKLVRPKGKLRGHTSSAPAIEAMETVRPLSTHALSKTRDVVDLGQNTSYMPRITVEGPAGSTIRLTHAEVLHDDGSINRDTCGGNRGPGYWQYTKATDQPESWFPQFFYAGCRFLQVDKIPATTGGELPKLASVEGVVVHSTAEPVGSFACSNELFNRIHKMVRWAQRSNMVSVLTDCPHREKLGWLEQYHLNGLGLRYEFDVSRIYIKSMQDMADSQLDSGLVPNIAPEYVTFPGTFQAAAEWGAAAIMVPWQHYLVTGDEQLLHNYYDSMQRYLDYLGTKASDHILDEGLGDWYDLVEGERPGHAKLTPPEVTATAFYCEMARTMAKIAELRGIGEDAERYKKLAAEIRAAWQQKFRRPDGTYGTGSQCSNALALAMDLAKQEDREATLAALIADVREHDNAMTTGDVGFGFLLQALTEAGRLDVVYQILSRTESPGYGYILSQGATSMTEAWDANHNASHNHFMLGQVMEWFYKDLVGIAYDPLHPGYERCIVRPNPAGDLNWAEATYNSIRGPFRVRWDRGGGRFKLLVDVPANATALVQLPSQTGDEITIDGRPAEETRGVSEQGGIRGRTSYEVKSGSYEFDAVWAADQ